MKYISLTRGKQTIVDDDMFDYLSKWKWYCTNADYAQRDVQNPEKKCIRMHRVIMNVPEGMEVDHINGNPLDNRKNNLRICTHAQNSCNTKLRSTNKTRFRGVSYFKESKKYRATIVMNYRQIHLGLFDSAEDAAHAYDEAAQKLHGKFARTNF